MSARTLSEQVRELVLTEMGPSSIAFTFVLGACLTSALLAQCAVADGQMPANGRLEITAGEPQVPEAKSTVLTVCAANVSGQPIGGWGHTEKVRVWSSAGRLADPEKAPNCSALEYNEVCNAWVEINGKQEIILEFDGSARCKQAVWLAPWDVVKPKQDFPVRLEAQSGSESAEVVVNVCDEKGCGDEDEATGGQDGGGANEDQGKAGGDGSEKPNAPKPEPDRQDPPKAPEP